MESGNLDLFQYLLGKGSHVFRKTKDKQNSCLHIAAVNGHVDLCKTLVEIYYLDILLADDDGWTVLHHAAKSGNLDLFQYLIGKGSDVFSKTKDKQNSCLHIAAVNRHVDLCKTLVEIYYLDILLADDDGWTVLHHAAKSGNLDLFQYLIGKESDVFSKTKNKQNSLHIAAVNGHAGLCKKLLEIYNLDILLTDDDGWAVLHHAAENGNLDLFQYLIGKGSDVYSKTKDKQNSCLHIAAVNGHADLCKILLEIYNLDILLTDGDEWTVLHHAAENGNLDLFQYLIGKWSDVYSKTKDKQNSLHIAAVNGHADLCKILLEIYNLDILLTDGDEWTVLYHAAENGNLDLFQYLIGKGSDVFGKTKDKQNSLHIAAVNGHAGLCKILLEIYNLDILLTDADGKTVLHHTAECGNRHLFQYLIGRGSDVFSKTKDKQNSLHIAALNGHADLCKTLLEIYNLDILLTDADGKTVLHYAAKSGNLHLFQYLLGKGSDILIKLRINKIGFTLLH